MSGNSPNVKVLVKNEFDVNPIHNSKPSSPLNKSKLKMKNSKTRQDSPVKNSPKRNMSPNSNFMSIFKPINIVNVKNNNNYIGEPAT